MAVSVDTASLTTLSATRLAALIRSGEVSSRDVVEAHIERCRRVNPKINAVIVERFDEARAEADAADRRVAEAVDSDELPPFLGVPCTIKESVSVKGMPNGAGVVALREHRAERTAPVAQRLLDSGAILLGLTNISELTLWIEAENRLYGRTNNVYDHRRSAGGSSGGEGAAVGAGIAPIGLGTDLAGSVRLPAFFGGVFGHRSSQGLLPLTGNYPPATGDAALMTVMGPFARRAEDLMPMLRVLSGPDGEDELAREIELGDPADVSFEGLRVAVSEGGHLGRISRELLDTRERAAGALAAAGARVENVKLASAYQALEIFLTTLSTAAGVTTRDLLMNAGAPPIRPRDLVRRGGDHTVATRLTLASEALAALAPSRRTSAVMAARDSFIDEFRGAIGDGVLLHPPAPKVAPRHGTTVGRLWWIVPMAIFNVAAVPATVVPMGLNENGLPLGVQVAAGPGRDHMTVATALELERVFGGWVAPPLA